MGTSVIQHIGFILGVLGQFLVSAATAMDMWGLQDRSFSVITSVYTYSGLWKSCVENSSGMTQCRPYFTILGLPIMLQAVRALMIVGIVLGAIGCLIAIFALKSLKMGNMEDNVKATMTLTSGVMFLLAGVCGIAGVSVFANLIVSSFRFTTYAGSRYGGGVLGGLGGSLTPRYTFGTALFVGWIGGAVLVVGGVMMCIACRGMIPSEEKRLGYGVAYKAASQHTTVYKDDAKPRLAYDESFRAQSMNGRHSNQEYV
ncbi:claudin-18-like [Salvelinus fontinalis]|uniref:claudin-18-like n=1 Tax=Salvelinus fontinalis TaxID=8038 RepID=UPI002486A428|nr:claudin-18-like [Salvelinus fontinalis]